MLKAGVEMAWCGKLQDDHPGGMRWKTYENRWDGESWVAQDFCGKLE